MTIDAWPNDDEMSERCACGCTLGQHHYGDERAACHECPCVGFHPVCSHDNRGECHYKHPTPPGDAKEPPPDTDDPKVDRP